MKVGDSITRGRVPFLVLGNFVIPKTKSELQVPKILVPTFVSKVDDDSLGPSGTFFLGRKKNFLSR